MIEQHIQCAITDTHSSAHSHGLDSISTSPQSVTVKLLQSEWLSAALVDSVSLWPLPLVQWRRSSSNSVEQRW